MTLINETYTSIIDVAAKYRLPVDYNPRGTGGFEHERDWAFRAGGRGLPGGDLGGWLITFAAPRAMFAGQIIDDLEQPAAGYLIAHAIGSDNCKTGELLVLAGPWNHTTDSIILEEAHTAGALGNVDDLVSWLALRG